jgi:diguanylate cyclase (GGDEF)-like protein
MIIMLQNDPVLFAISAGVCSAVSAGVAARNPSSPRLNSVYLLLLNVPLGIGSLFNSDHFFYWICILEPAFLFPLIRQTKQFHLDYVMMTVAQIENSRHAYRCPLTGLPNRRMFNAHFSKLMETSSGAGYALMLIDLDGFKVVNDTFGHQAGDELLVQVADRLKQFVCEDDVCARLGGDEFALIVNANTRQINELAAGIVETVSQPFQLGETSTVVIGASIGIMLINEGASLGAIPMLMRRADEALYAAKSAGRGTFRHGSGLTSGIGTVPDAA